MLLFHKIPRAQKHFSKKAIGTDVLKWQITSGGGNSRHHPTAAGVDTAAEMLAPLMFLTGDEKRFLKTWKELGSSHCFCIANTRPHGKA